MKVINTWDAPEEPTMNSRCADCRCDRPPMPAAGPWRYDVENAPKDGSEILLAWRDCIGEPHCESFHWDADDNVWINGDGGFIEDSGIRAFAAINQPETTP